MIRFLKVLLRGLRPISRSLAQISADLHTISRIHALRLLLEHNQVLTDEQLSRKPSKDDFTEISYKVVEPEIDPQTGKAKVEDDAWNMK